MAKTRAQTGATQPLGVLVRRSDEADHRRLTTLSFDGSKYTLSEPQSRAPRSTASARPPSDGAGTFERARQSPVVGHDEGRRFVHDPARPASSLDSFKLSNSSPAAIAAGIAGRDVGGGRATAATGNRFHPANGSWRATHRERDQPLLRFDQRRLHVEPVDVTLPDSSVITAGQTIPYDSSKGLTVTSKRCYGDDLPRRAPRTRDGVQTLAPNKGGTSDGSKRALRCRTSSRRRA